MFKRKNTEKPIYGIIGLGRFGKALAITLAQLGAELLVLDKDEEKVREMKEYTDYAFVVRSLDKKTLTEIGIQNCDVGVVCIGSHLDTSILTALNLVSLGVLKVIAKANSVEHGEILKKIGAEVVYPENDMAIRLANRLENSKFLDFLQLSEKINISKIAAPKCTVGKTVVEMNFRSRFGLNIIAIESGGKVIEHIKPEYIFRQGDTLFLSGSNEGMADFSRWISKQK